MSERQGKGWRSHRLALGLLWVCLGVALPSTELAAQILVRAEGTVEVDFISTSDPQVIADLEALGVEAGATGTAVLEYDLTVPVVATSLFFNALANLEIRVGDFSVDAPAPPPCSIFSVDQTCSSFNVVGNRVDVQAEGVMSPELGVDTTIIFMTLNGEPGLDEGQALAARANGGSQDRREPYSVFGFTVGPGPFDFSWSVEMTSGTACAR